MYTSDDTSEVFLFHTNIGSYCQQTHFSSSVNLSDEMWLADLTWVKTMEVHYFNLLWHLVKVSIQTFLVSCCFLFLSLDCRRKWINCFCISKLSTSQTGSYHILFFLPKKRLASGCSTIYINQVSHVYVKRIYTTILLVNDCFQLAKHHFMCHCKRNGHMQFRVIFFAMTHQIKCDNLCQKNMIQFV